MRLPAFNIGTPNSLNTLVDAISKALRPVVQQVNALGDGQLTASNTAATAPPSGTTTPNAVGDFVRNSVPSELGSTGSKYIILGWVCVTAGSPGTWRQCRTLTGN